MGQTTYFCPMVLRFHQCVSADVPALARLAKSTFTIAFQHQNNPVDFERYVLTAFSEETLRRKLLQNDSSFYFIYNANEGLIGYVKLNWGRAQSEFKDEEGLELERFYVLSSYQNQGYGGRIIREIIRIAVEKEKRYIWLGVWEKNPSAIRFYERHGFKKIGTHPYFIGCDKQTDWLMKKEMQGVVKVYY